MHLVLWEHDGDGSEDGKIWINTKDILKDGQSLLIKRYGW